MHSSAVVLALVGLVAFLALAVPVEGTTYDRDVHDFASRGDEILDSRGQGDFDLSGQIGQFFNNHHLGFLNNIRRDDLVGQSDLSSSSDVLNRILDLFPADSQGQTLVPAIFLAGWVVSASSLWTHTGRSLEHTIRNSMLEISPNSCVTFTPSVLSL
ncbi:hypothetical protein B0F90DRAFT_1353029 [Multifurca ochricompacta]|uniref:Uncharacterized protein n=1 Tax=Multifurca ochricompacta TaxID=376703 RepID=A0AAD4LX22_9AGAM|nr:hypothetical protein B0F90DRAFT_1353029 [Multifurca ochricompacta]